MTVTAVEASENSKTGPISTTYVSQKSCPNDCPLLKAGCYAEMGFVGMVTSRLNRTREKDPVKIARKEAKAISGLSGQFPLRLHVVGDARTNGAAKVLARQAKAYSALHGNPVFTYTHAWRKVLRSSWGSVSVLASTERPSDIPLAQNRGYATAIVVPKFLSNTRYEIEGNKVIPCPAQTKNITCFDCRLCFKDDFLVRNKLTIGFEAHGGQNTKSRALKTLSKME